MRKPIEGKITPTQIRIIKNKKKKKKKKKENYKNNLLIINDAELFCTILLSKETAYRA